MQPEAVRAEPVVQAGAAVRAGPAGLVRQAALREEPGAQLELVSVRPQVLQAVLRVAVTEVQAVRWAASGLAVTVTLAAVVISCRRSSWAGRVALS